MMRFCAICIQTGNVVSLTWESYSLVKIVCAEIMYMKSSDLFIEKLIPLHSEDIARLV